MTDFAGFINGLLEGKTYKLEVTDTWSRNMRSISIAWDITWVVVDVVWDYNSTGFNVEHVGTHDNFADALQEWFRRVNEAFAPRGDSEPSLPGEAA